MKYTVGRAARHDIDSIAAFYAGERRDLGARFIEEVYRSLQLLQKYPRLGQRVGENNRRFPLHGFPFFINYRIDDTSGFVRVIAVSDQRRRPGYWVGRVEEPRLIYGRNWCQTPIIKLHVWAGFITAAALAEMLTFPHGQESRNDLLNLIATVR